MRASGPYPVLAVAGEQGSAKTVLSKLLRAVIDPSVAPVRALPHDERELFIAASISAACRPVGYTCCRVYALSGAAHG
jgi:hypothetical protein